MATKYLVESGANGTTHFATIYQWLTSLPATLTEVERLEIASDFSYAHGVGSSDNLPSGITTAVDKYLEIYVPPEYRHDGRPRSVSGKGFRITGTVAYSLGAKHARLNGAEIDITDASASALILASGASSDIRVENCLVHNSATGTVVTVSVGANGVLWRNNMTYGSCRSWDSRGSSGVVIEKSDFWQNGDQLGVLADSGTTITDTYSGKSTGSQACFWLSGTTLGSNNASSDTSATAMFTGSQANIAGSAVFNSVTAGAEDFKLKSGTNPLQTAVIGARETNTVAGPTAPGAPTIGTLTAGNGSVSQAFTAPASDGGSAITGYTLTVYKASDNTVVTTATGASSPISAAVANGLAVYGKVKATNSVGTGPESAASNTVTPSVPMPAPTAARTGRTFSGSTVSYTFSTTNDPTGGDFTLTATSGPGATLGPTALTRDNVADTASVSLSGLVAGSTYVESGVVSNTGGSNNITGVGSFSVSAIDGTPIDGDSVGNAAPTFIGTLANITGTAGVAISPVNVSSLFSDTDTLTYSVSPGGTAWPSGLSINSSTGVISGTIASASTTSGLKVRATDTASQTVDSNAFNVAISAVAPTVTSVVVSPSSAIITGGTIDFDAVVNGTNSPSQAVNWGADAGSIDGNGIFTPPARTFLIQTITITATSVLDPSKSGTATVVILALPIPSEGNIMAQQVDTSQLMNQSQLGARAQRALSQIIEGLIDDVAALRAGVMQQAAKLDQDAGVTDTNYSTTVAAVMGNTVVVK